MRSHLLPLIGAVILAGCEVPTATLSAPAPLSPSLDFSNGPEAPGDVVLRVWDEEMFLILNADRAAGLFAVMRQPSPAADLVPCGGSQWLDPAAVQFLFRRNGTVGSLLTGDALHTAIYERRSFNAALRVGGVCGALATQVPLAEGEARLLFHDNDTFFSGVRTNAFGFSARGTLRTPGGEVLDYRNQYAGVVDAAGELVHLVSTVTVRPARP